MLKRNTFLISSLAVLLLVAGGCTNDTLDDGDSADVILEVDILSNPAVSAALDTTTGACTFTVEDWTVDISNKPKNTSATGPFNDVEMISVTINYTWINPALSTPDSLIGLASTTIPADGTAQVNFAPIAFDYLTLAHSSSVANLIMTFDARTIEGTRISKTVLRQLQIEGCV